MSTDDFSNSDIQSLVSLRGGGLAGMAYAFAAKAASAEKLARFTAARFGKEDASTSLARAAVDDAAARVRILRAEEAKTRVEVPDVDEETMAVSGIVTRDGEPVETMTVAAYSAEGKLLGKGCTGEGGRFVLEIGDAVPFRLVVLGTDGRECYADPEIRPFMAGDSLFVSIDIAKDGICADPPEERTEPKTVTVPDLVGRTVREAEARLRRAQLVPGEQISKPDAERDGLVIEQKPKAGTQAKPGDSVAFVVGAKPEETHVVPDVTGAPVRRARAVLAEAGYPDIEFSATRSDKAAIIVEQKPKGGTPVDPGSTVALAIGISGELKADAPALVEFYDAEASAASGRIGGAAVLDRLIAGRIDSYERLTKILDSKDEVFGPPLGIVDAARLKAIRSTLLAVLKRIKRVL